MPASLKDTDQGWGVAIGDLKDALGELVDKNTVGIVFEVDDASLVALVDNGNGTATFGSALLPDNTVDLPASTPIRATITNPGDGTSFVIEDVLTVVPSDAVTGDFQFSPPA